jgi:hypothetical protein
MGEKNTTNTPKQRNVYGQVLQLLAKIEELHQNFESTLYSITAGTALRITSSLKEIARRGIACNCIYIFAGWLRDLLREGIEANPGPSSWYRLIEAIRQELGAISPEVMTLLQGIYEKIVQQFFVVNTKHVQEYLTSLDPNSGIPDEVVEVIYQALANLGEGTGLRSLFSLLSTAPPPVRNPGNTFSIRTVLFLHTYSFSSGSSTTVYGDHFSSIQFQSRRSV